MILPNNINLPYFAYGLFKPGELAYPKIKNFVEGAPKKFTVDQCRLWVRDGLPIIDLKTDGQVVGYELNFREQNYEIAYNIVSNFVSIPGKRLYEWGDFNLCDNNMNLLSKMNVLTWQKPPKTSIDIDIKEWSAKNDPLFTKALDNIKRTINLLAQIPFVGDPFEWDRFFELQKAYKLLWSAIERYCSFAYGPLLNSSERRRELAQSKPFRNALKKVLRKHHYFQRVHVIHDYQNPDKWKKLHPQKPLYSIGYYYLVRCNLAHQGKSERSDGEIIRRSLIELFEIFRIILDETL